MPALFLHIASFEHLNISKENNREDYIQIPIMKKFQKEYIYDGLILF